MYRNYQLFTFKSTIKYLRGIRKEEQRELEKVSDAS